jgi:hypothetical protein
MGDLTVTFLDAGDLRAMNKRLRQLEDGKELRKAFTTQVRAELRPVVAQVKAAYTAIPSPGHASSSKARQAQPALRVLLAKATHMEVKLTGRQAGVRIRVDGRRMPDRMKSLPAYREGYKPRWRWPVFGHREVWVQGRPRPLFDRIVESSVERVHRRVQALAADLARKIEGA